MMNRLRLLLAIAATVGATADLGAQGALSVLGLGYPVGGQSTRSLGAGSAIAGLDPQSPLNPASIALNARAQGYVQFEPEFRTVTVGGNSAKTTTARFPVFMVTGRMGRATYALSYSSFLDRTWANSYADTQAVGSERIASTVLAQSAGGITDARFAGTWSFNESLHLGIGLHLFPGQNRVVNGRVFSDTSKAGSFELSENYNFTGTGVSFGGVYAPGAHLVFNADMRLGGTLTMRRGDSTEVGRGTVPFRAGVGATYDGIPGSIFSVRFGTETWSDLAAIGSSSLQLRDATDLSVGTEFTGPRIAGSPIYFRAGFRSRGLPAAYGTQNVKESSLSGGLGIPVAGGKSNIDLALVRSSRTASGVSEKAWIVSVGVGIRP